MKQMSDRGNVERGDRGNYKEKQMTNIKIIVEKHSDGYVAYPLGIQGIRGRQHL